MPAAKPSRVFSFLTICLLVLLTACGTAGNQTSSTQATPTATAGDPQQQPTTPANPRPSGLEYVYFGYSGDIYGFELQNDGSLIPTPNSPYNLKGDTTLSTNLTLNPAGTLGFASTGQICYSSCEGTNSISTYAVSGSTGELDLLRVDTSVGFLANDAFDDSGQYLYASANSGLKAYSVSPEGYLSELQGSPFPSIFGTLLKDPASNRFFIVGWQPSHFQATYISSFMPNPQNGKPVTTDGPTSFESASLGASTIDTEGKYLVSVDIGQSPTMHVFSINPEISEVRGSPFPANCDGRSLSIDPTGPWLYCTSANGRIGIAQYSFDKTSGSIGEEISFVPTTAIVQTLALNRGGNFLIASSVPVVQTFAIDSVSGQLHPVRKYSLY